MTKIYLTAVAIVGLLVESFGFILPWLFSQPADELVTAGFGILIGLPILLSYLVKSLIEQIVEKVDQQ